MVDGEIIRMTLRYVERDPKKIKDAYESAGVCTVDDLAKLDSSELAEILNVEEKVAQRIIRLARAKGTKVEVDTGKDKGGVERIVPPYLAAVLSANQSRGVIVPLVLGSSYTGKSTMCRFVADVTLRARGTITPAGLASALEESKHGVIVDDAQRAKNIETVIDVIRGIVETDKLRGGNIRYEGKLKNVMDALIHNKKTFLVNWDTSMEDLKIKKSDRKRVLLILPRKGLVCLPYPCKRFMVRGHIVPFEYRDPEKNPEIITAKVHHIYYEQLGVKDVADDVHAVLTEVKEILKVENMDELVRAIYSDYEDILDVDDDDVFDWWMDVSRETLLDLLPKIDCKGDDRLEYSVVLLYVISTSSLIGYRCGWDIDGFPEFEEVADIVKKFTVRAIDKDTVSPAIVRRAKRVLLRNAKQHDPPF